jgi:NADH-quinone oxidoreductase subunit J
MMPSIISGNAVAFWMITLLVLSSAAYSAFSRSVARAAFGLFFTLAGMAGYYVLLGSAFVATTQVVIYVGGILVLLMFGVLLTYRPLEKSPGKGYVLTLLAGIILTAFVTFGLIIAVRAGHWGVPVTPVAPVPDTRLIGRALVTDYLLPFELAGMTLLLCLIGAAYLVRRHER